MSRTLLHAAISLSASLGAGAALATPDEAAEPPLTVAQAAGGPGLKAPRPAAPGEPLTREQGLIIFDYEVIPVPGLPSIDLMGAHFYKHIGHGLHLGAGGYAPLLRGEYGGFMTFDVSAHLQRSLGGRLFATAGLSVGGGGGGKSAEQSKVLSGTGGYVKAYAGLGYAFDSFSVGLNVSRFRFNGSAIGHTHPSLFLQLPFSYGAGGYANAGQRIDDPGTPDDGSESALTLGLDNYHQIDPKGRSKGTLSLINLQYSQFFAKDDYWFIDIGLGYRGLPLYNQLIGGVGRRLPLGPNLRLYGQIGIGSGGYAPDTIDTGPGLLIYPKLGLEVMLSRQLGVALTGGYMVAPRGSSKNATYGVALNYRLNSEPAPSGGGDAVLRGYRISLMHQTEFNVSVANRTPPDIRLIGTQIDLQLDARSYVAMQLAVASNAYLGYPGYGYLLLGGGVQTRRDKGERLQFFGQLLAGPNVHGLVLKPQVGLNIGLSEDLALYLQAGRTIGLGDYGQNTNKQKLRANQIGIGLSYRFSLPTR